MEEEWKQLEGYSLYLISNTGKIKEVATERLLPQTVNGGFWCSNLHRDDGVKELAKVHRLVATLFVPNEFNANRVGHKEDRLDNTYTNLEWKPKRVKEVIEKEIKTLTHLGRTYTYAEFCEAAKCEISTLRSRLNSGWTVRECFIGVKDFKGQGYQDEYCWYPTRQEYESGQVQRRLEQKVKDKQEKNKRNALKRAERKAKIHHGFGIFVNYPIKGIEGRRPSRAYYVWQGIIARCHNVDHDSYERYGGRGCTVSEKWKHFQDFVIWYQEQQKRGMGNAHVNWHVDKDILVDGNLEYGPDTCCFVPDDVNIFFASLKETARGYTEYKGKWTSGVSILGSKNQRCFDTEDEARNWYLKGKSMAAQLLLWKYEGLLEDRVVNKLSQI